MNTLKTGLLMLVLTLLLLVAGYFIGGPTGITVALVFSLIMNFAAYWYSDRIALAMAGAREVSPSEEPELHRIVEEQAMLARLPKPRVYVIRSDSPNAFATGRDPKHAAVAVTRGIMRILNRQELGGVIAHELAHIRNRDTLIMTVAAAIAGAITWIAFMARWAMFFGGWGGGWGGGRRSGYEALIGLAGLLIVAIVLPMAALLIRMAISRAREYEADATGARTSGNPWALADALEKLERGARMRPMRVNEGVSHLFIVNPLSGRTVVSLFSTHPPIAERVRRLRSMRPF
jgi:heat shock protein HtpX